MKPIHTDPHVDAIVMPENLRVGLMIAEERKKCQSGSCPFDYAGFAFGQSPFHVPPPLEKALAANASRGHYSAAEGIAELREAIAGFNQRYFDLEVDPLRIVVGPGTKDLIFSVFTMISGDAVIPSPSWIGYAPQLKLLGKHYHVFHLRPEDGYKIRPEALDDFLSGLAAEGRQHMLVLNNPHNPTGALYTREELEAIAEACLCNNTLVLADEIYALSTYRFEDFTSMARVYPQGSFVTNGLSKDRSAGGYRLGSCILPEKYAEKLRDDFLKVAATVYTNVSTPTQHAAIAAYEPNREIDEYFRVTREIHRIMGTYLSDEFNKIEGIQATCPEGSFYFYVDFNQLAGDLKRKGVMTSNQLGQSLLAHPYHIATVTGDAVMLDPEDYGARIAFVDYDGKAAFDRFRKNPPKTRSDEIEFVGAQAPRMIRGVEMLRSYVRSMRS